MGNFQGLAGGVSAYNHYQVRWGSKSDVACVYTAVGHSDQIVIDCVWQRKAMSLD